MSLQDEGVHVACEGRLETEGARAVSSGLGKDGGQPSTQVSIRGKEACWFHESPEMGEPYLPRVKTSDTLDYVDAEGGGPAAS